MSETAGGRILAGLDEAGLGPLLGPLTIGFSALRVPDGCSGGAGLWKRLRAAVSDDPGRDESRLIVADSKVVFTRNERGHARLEQTALSFLTHARTCAAPPRRGADLLATLGPIASPDRGLLDRHPWYAHLPERLPVWSEEPALAEHTERLAGALERREVELLAAGVRVVPAGELNDSYEHTRSKGLTLWWKTADLLDWLWNEFPGEPVTLVVDRHGGRTHYGELLAQTFPFASIDTVRERDGRGHYRVREGGSSGRCLDLYFRERAEEHSFAVALASCLAKYVREVCMAAFNDYFAELQPDLTPTAGYRNDGQRWLREAREAVQRADLHPGVLIRTR